MEFVYKNKVKEKLLENKLEYGETFVKVASKLNWTKQQIDIVSKCKIENATIGTVVKLSRALGCEIGDLLEAWDIDSNYRII